MATVDRPKLRPLSPFVTRQNGLPCVALVDPFGVVADPVVLLLGGYEQVVRQFDGTRSLPEIQAGVLRQTGQFLPMEQLEALVDQLEQRMAIEGPSFGTFLESFKASGTRRPALAGRAYAGTPKALEAQLSQLFADERGAGLPASSIAEDGGRRCGLRGILSPHIDFKRGGTAYTHAYRALVEGSDAETFVILGVAHRPCDRRFALTYKDFETPLGLARTDRRFIDRVAALAGDQVFEDELAHLNEHSIEFQVLFLQYLLADRRDFSIVPILVGSFDDLMARGDDPIRDVEVRRFIEALKAAEGASDSKVAYIGGIDLGHIGREFGDPDLLDDRALLGLRSFDAELLRHATAGDAASWFRTAASVSNRWRVCGLAATYTMLHAIGPSDGRVLRYDQAVNPERTCCVSFASLAFHRRPAPARGAPGVAEDRSG